MINKKKQQLLTYILFSIIAIYNLRNSKFKELFLMVLSFILFSIFTKQNLIERVSYSILITLIFGILVHFHLMENFMDEKITDKIDKIINRDMEPQIISKNEEKPKINNNQQIIEKDKKIKYKKVENIENINDISIDLLLEYIKYLEDNSKYLISTRKIVFEDLIPTINELNIDHIKFLKDKIKNGTYKNESPIICNDNFIVKGHYTWYLLKHKLITRKKFITVKIINLPYKQLLTNLNEFKSKSNYNNLKEIDIDKNKIEDAKNAIKNIQDNIKLLENYHKHITNLNIL